MRAPGRNFFTTAIFCLVAAFGQPPAVSASEPPVLVGTPIVTPDSVDVSSSMPIVHVRVGILDPDSDLLGAQFGFAPVDSSGESFGALAFLTEGTARNGFWEADFTVPPSALGIYRLGVVVYTGEITPLFLLPTEATLEVTGGDQVPPALSGPVTLEPETIDLTGEDGQVTVMVPLFDAGYGVERVEAWFPAGDTAYAASGEGVLDSGNSNTGTWRVPVIIPANTAEGIYPLEIETRDFAGNDTTIVTGLSLVVGGGDAAEPFLVGSATVEPDTIDIFLSAVPVAVTAGLGDDGSGVGRVTARFRDAENALVAEDTLALASGSRELGTWAGTVLIPEWVPDGTLDLLIQAGDLAGNEVELAAGVTLTVRRTDSSGPVLDGEPAIEPDTVNASGSERTATVTARLTDDRSGVESVFAVLRPAGDGDSLVVSATLLSGDSLDGTWMAAIEIPPDASAGTLRLAVRARDYAGNTSWFDTKKDLLVVRDEETPVTFQVDARSLLRPGFLRPDRGMRLHVDLFDDLNPVTVALTDADGDSIFAATVPRRTGTTAHYRFLFDAGFTEPGRWFAESGAGRSITLSSTAPVVLPPVAFDNLALGTTPAHASARGTWSFWGGATEVSGEIEIPPVHLAIGLSSLQGGLVVAARRYAGGAGGVPPAGVVVLSSAVHWEIATFPAAAAPPAVLAFPFDLYGGVSDPAALRWLRRTAPGDPWEVVATAIDPDARLVRATGSALAGEWTLGSTSDANSLAPSPPDVASIPNPLDGGYVEAKLLELVWSVTAGATAYDVYFWEEGTPRPNIPTVAGLTRPVFTTPAPLVSLTSHHWQVVARNAVGATPGPVWSFTVDHVADLVVSGIHVPPEAFAGQSIEVEWTVTNEGTDGTSSPEWLDAVFFSNDPAFDLRTDPLLGSFTNPAHLAPGESYRSTQEVGLPKNIAGDGYLFVRANSWLRLNEASVANNLQSAAIRVEAALRPDLEVQSLTAPDRTFSGQPITVSWRVRNRGPAPLVDLAEPLNSLGDGVYLSADSLLDLEDDRLIGSAPAPTIIPPDSSYVMSVRFPHLPDSLFGNFHLILVSDLRNAFPELDDVGNNRRTRPITITLTPPPDLETVSIGTPSGASSGRSSIVSWQVGNLGPGPVPATSWSDRVLLLPQAGASVDTPIVLGTFARVGPVAADSAYEGSAAFRFPDGVFGPFRIRVVPDWDNRLFEYTGEGNNLGDSEPFTIALSPSPDFVPVGLEAAGDIAAGESMELRWTVRNAGSDTADTPWIDRVYLTPTAAWDSATAVPISAARQEDELPAGGFYSAFAIGRIPAIAAGGWYLRVVADADGRIYEHLGEDNNRSSAMPITIRPIAVDLQVVEVIAPGSAESGAAMTVSWTVRNSGTAPTTEAAWADGIYLSSDRALDEGDLELDLVPRTGPLRGGDNSGLVVDFELPETLPTGSYYVFVRTDPRSQVPERNETNNVTAAPQPVQIVMLPPPDLRIEAVAGAATAAAGQPYPLSFHLRNAGAGATRDSAWFQAVHVSKYPVVDGRARFLGSFRHAGPLAAGASAPVTVNVAIPTWLSGTWYLLVEADARGDVYEGTGEVNNTAFSLVTFDLPPPTDLVVTSVAVEPEAQAGDSVTVTWTLENRGTHTARGFMTDAVYMSADTDWTVDDPLVALLDRSIDLPGGAALKVASRVSLASPQEADLEGNIRRPLPGLLPGAWHAAVRTNVRATIRETDRTNNLGVSAGVVDVGIPLLPFDTPTTVRLTEGGSVFYRVEVPEELGGSTMSIRLDGPNAAASHELFLRFGEPPARSRYDASGSTPFGAHQEAIIPAADPGTWYLMGFGDRGSAGGDEVTLTAHILTFSLDHVSPGAGGNAGNVTIELKGAAIDPGVRPRLVRGATRLEPDTVHWVDPTTVFATWNLSGAPLGAYDVVAEQAVGRFTFTGDLPEPWTLSVDTLSVTLPGAFTVEPPRSVPVDLRVSFPRRVRILNHFEFAVEATNLSNHDVRTPVVYVIAVPDFPKGNGSGGNILPGGRLYLMSPREGPAGILRPGITTTVEIEGVAPGEPGFRDIHVLAVEERTTPFNLDRELVEIGVDPASPTWSEAVDRLRARHIASWKEYADFLAERASAFPNGIPVPRSGDELLLAILNEEAEAILHPLAQAASPAMVQLLPGIGEGEPLNAPANPFAEPDCSPGRIMKDQSIVSFTVGSFVLLGANVGASHLIHYGDGTGIPITYDDESEVADMVRQTKNANRSLDMVHDRVAQQIHEQVEARMQASDCDPGAAPKPEELFLYVQPLDFYPPGRGGAVTVSNAIHRDLILGFGGMRRATGRVTELQVSARKTSKCAHLCDEFVCHVSYSGVVEYRFQDDYEYSREDCGSSSMEGAFCNLQKCGQVKPFVTEIQVKKKFSGSFVFTGGGGSAPAWPGEFAAAQSECDPGDRGDRSPVEFVSSLDPNDIIGPPGAGDARWVARTDVLPYRIRFENDPAKASAPAQIVTVTQKLDPEVDARSFRLGRFGFGSFEFAPPAGASYYTDRLDVRDSLGIFVDVTAGIDITNGEAFWTFKSIDPAGGDLPQDPLAGFLPVNDAANHGSGFVSYTVRPRPTSRTGDVITAEAAIVFDQNPVIETPSIFNTIDADPPRSRIRPLPAVLDTLRIPLAFEGGDSTGSGVRTWRLFGARDEEPFTLLHGDLDEPRVTVDGEFGHSYRFFVDAVDRTGNREPAKTSAEVTVRLDSTGVVPPPAAFRLFQNTPNPFRGTTTILFSTPGPGQVTVRLFDIAGRLVRTVTEARMDGGPHALPLDLTGRAGGIYFVEIRHRQDGGGEKRASRKIVFAP